MRNWQRWIVTLSLAFFGGIIQCASDSKPQTLGDYVRHGLIGLGPAVAALQLTLNRQESEAKAKGAGNGN